MKKIRIKERKFSSDAITLDIEYVDKRNDSGWYISATINHDYYDWVNLFIAKHEKFGIVCGDFEDEIFATSKKAYKDFVKKHPPTEWDYRDI